MDAEFELNQQIDRWLTELSEQSNLTVDDRCELRSHLLDSVDSLTATGLSQQEAFLVATHRLGSVESLQTEFSKLNRSSPRQREVALGVMGAFGFVVITSCIQAISSAFSWVILNWWRDSPLTPYMATGFYSGLLGLIGMGWLRFSRQAEKAGPWYFGRDPDWLVWGLTILIGLGGIISLAAYLIDQPVNGWQQFSSNSGMPQHIGQIRTLFWLGYYSYWLLVSLRTIRGQYASDFTRGFNRLKRESILWRIGIGFGLFASCLGLNLVITRFFFPQSDWIAFYGATFSSSLLSGWLINKGAQESLVKRFLVTMVPLLIGYALIVLGFEGQDPLHLAPLFSVKDFFTMATIGWLISLLLIPRPFSHRMYV